MDYIVVGSDSGRIVILSYDAKKNRFVKVHEETYGKSGCRRIVPGEYIAVDPKGRAVMIGAVEKQKFVYILNRKQRIYCCCCVALLGERERDAKASKYQFMKPN